jgi:hypothetical protein
VDEHRQEFEALLERLRSVGDVLGECGQTCAAIGAYVTAGMIAGAAVIVEELVCWLQEQMEEQKAKPPEEEPS